jgi:hypothetical protein
VIPLWWILRRAWTGLGLVLGYLGPFLGCLGPVLGALGALLASLRWSWAMLGRAEPEQKSNHAHDLILGGSVIPLWWVLRLSWTGLGPVLGCLGPVLGCLERVLGDLGAVLGILRWSCAMLGRAEPEQESNHAHDLILGGHCDTTLVDLKGDLGLVLGRS